MQLDENLETIAASEVQRRKEIQERRILQKLGESRSTTVGAPVNFQEVDVQVDAQAPPLGRSCESANEADGFRPRGWRNRRRERRQARGE